MSEKETAVLQKPEQIYKDKQETNEEKKPMVKKAVFNPETPYQWQPDDEFQISGRELHLMYNILETFFKSNLPDQQKHVMLHDVLKLSIDIVRRNVEDGKIVELPADQIKQEAKK